jgi:SSS family solute:Na+ symporter
MSRVHFAFIDIFIISAYFLFTLIVGFWKRKQQTEDYLIANRSLSMPVFVATLVATWYGGILGVGEMTYRYGLVNWTLEGFPYYVFALLFALVFATKVREASLYTIPDKIYREYDRKTGLLGAFYAFFMVTPAPYILMVGQLVSIICGWPLFPSLIIGSAFSVVYVYFGGFQSDVRINVFQFCLMFAGFAVALPVLFHRYGGFQWIAHHVPSEYIRLDGGLPFTYILVWFLIALWTLVDPGFHQRCYAAKTPRIARNGIIVAIVCWAVFDFMTTTAGLYAKAIMPHLSENRIPYAFPLLAELFPPIIKGLFYVAMLATVMSTVVSYTFLSAMTIGRDFWWRLSGKIENDMVPRYTRFGLVVSIIVAIVISYYVPSVVKQWWVIGTIFVPGMIFPVLTSYLHGMKTKAIFAFLELFLGSGVSAVCVLIGWVGHGINADMSDSSLFPFHIQPMYPGLCVSLFIYMVGLMWNRLDANKLTQSIDAVPRTID